MSLNWSEKLHVSKFVKFIQNKREISVFTLILFVGGALYAHTLGAGFEFDDYRAIVNNPFIKHFDILLLFEAFNARFLAGLTFAVNYWVAGLDAGAFRVVNIFLHCCVSFCVYLLVRTTLSRQRTMVSFDEEGIEYCAIISAVLFLVHPVQTESVIYISQRTVLLAALFFVGTLLLYAQSRFRNSSKFLWAAYLCAFVAQFTRETVLTLPIILVVYDLLFIKTSGKRIGDAVRRVSPFVGISFLIPLCVVRESRISLFSLKTEFLSMGPGWHAFMTFFKVIGTYLRLLFLPINLTLDYDCRMSQSLFSISTIIPICVTALLFVCVRLFYRKKKIVSFGLVWFLVTIGFETLACCFIGRDLIFEHRLYLPMVGAVMVCGYALVRVLCPHKRWLRAVSLVLFTIFVLLSYSRGNVWHDSEMLWKDTIARSPAKARPYNNLGYVYFARGDSARAIAAFQKAIELDSNYYEAYVNLGTSYYQAKNFKKADRIFEKAMRLDPNKDQAYAFFGNRYLNAKDFVSANDFFSRALTINPYCEQALIGQGNVSIRQGDVIAAKKYFERAVWSNPENYLAQYNLGNAFFYDNSFDKAFEHYQKTVEIEPRFAAAYNNMGNVLFQFGSFYQSVEYYQKAVLLDPHYAQAYFNLANAQYATGQRELSKRTIRRAIQLYEDMGETEKAAQLKEKISLGR